MSRIQVQKILGLSKAINFQDLAKEKEKAERNYETI